MDLNERIGHAARWSAATEIAAKLAAPLTNGILARLLMPEVFGVVAALTLVTGFAEIITAAGAQKYLVQHSFSGEAELDSCTNGVFWIHFPLSLLLWGLIGGVAEPIAGVVGAPGYGSAVAVMGAQIPLLTLSGIQSARFRRDFGFRSLFGVRIAVSLVPLAVTVPAALLLKNHWALVIGTLARDALNAVLLTVKSPWRPGLGMEFSRWKQMLPHMLWYLVESMTVWLTANVGLLILSSCLQPYYLGLYKTAITTANGYLGIITAAATPVLFSGLSRYQGDPNRFRDLYFRFQRNTALVVFPLAVGVFVFRDLATWILLGSRWQETADFLGLWFLMSGLTMVFHNYNSEAFRSMGKPALSILVQLIYMAVLIPALLWTAAQSYRVMTTVRALMLLWIIAVSSGVLQCAVGIRFWESVKNVWPSLTAAVLMGITAWLLERFGPGGWWQLLSAGFCAGVYVGLLWLIPAGRQQFTAFFTWRKAKEQKP